MAVKPLGMPSRACPWVAEQVAEGSEPTVGSQQTRVIAIALAVLRRLPGGSRADVVRHAATLYSEIGRWLRVTSPISAGLSTLADLGWTAHPSGRGVRDHSWVPWGVCSGKEDAAVQLAVNSRARDVNAQQAADRHIGGEGYSMVSMCGLRGVRLPAVEKVVADTVLRRRPL